MTASGPIYQIYDRLEDATLEGGFDTQKWAESICRMMNDKEMERGEKTRLRARTAIIPRSMLMD